MTSSVASLQAGTGEVIRLPTGNTKPKNGLKVVIDHRWLAGNGYRPVQVEVINWPPGPTKADRTICVVLQPNSYGWAQPEQHVTQYIELPQGTSRASATIAVPQHNAWQAIMVSVYEDGRLCEDLSENVGIAVRSIEWSEANPAILIIDSDAPTRDARQKMLNVSRSGNQTESLVLPDTRFLTEFFPTSTNVGNRRSLWDEGADDNLTLASLQMLPKVDLLPLSALPERWIDYTCCDMIFISFADLQTLARQHSVPWKAIRQWVRSGPVLCVYDMDLSQEQLDQLSLLLELPVAELQDGETSFSSWRRPKEKTADETIRALDDAYEYYAQYNQTYEEAQEPPAAEAEPSAAEEPPPPESDVFLYRRVHLGYVAAIRTAEPLHPGKYKMPWMLNELGADKWMWYQRHGMSMHRENAAYWDWMIPGVGSAPVGSYLLLITVFVIVIGPVNYFFLRKKKRLYMLLVTVPLGAGLVTAALLNYALITDGLAVRARVRSYTQIDQRSRAAESWSRQTYYAGLAPSGGLSYPEDTAVYRIDQYPSGQSNQGVSRQLYWDGEQNLTSGYLGSRSSTQLMVVRSTASERGLEVVVGDDGDAAPQVTNNLDAAIVELVVTDRAGRHYSARDIQPGEQFRPEPTTLPVAIDSIRGLVEAGRPAFPVGYDRQSYSRAVSFSGYYWGGWSDVDQSLPPPAFGLGVLERSIRMAQSGDGVGWQPGGYVAITDTSPETPLGYKESREEASFHMIVGQW